MQPRIIGLKEPTLDSQGGDAAPFATLLSLVSSKQTATKKGIVVTAERYTVAGGLATSFVDWLDSSTTYSQGVVGLQVPEPSPDLSLGNRRTITLAVGKGIYASNQAKALYKWLGDGSGATVYTILKPVAGVTTFSLSTAAFAVGIGFDGGGCRDIAGTQQTLLRVRNAVGAWAAAGAAAAGLVSGTWATIREEAKDNGVGNPSAWTYVNGTQNSSGNAIAAPSAADPQITASLLYSGVAQFYGWIGIPAMLTTGEKQIVTNWTRSLGLGAA